MVFAALRYFKTDFFPDQIAQSNFAGAAKVFRARIVFVQIIDRDDDIFRFKISFEFFEQSARHKSLFVGQGFCFVRFFGFDEIVIYFSDVFVVGVDLDVENDRQIVIL